MPERIQRQRTRGWRMPPLTKYVGRPTRWGNRWHVWRGRDRTVAGTYLVEDDATRAANDVIARLALSGFVISRPLPTQASDSPEKP